MRKVGIIICTIVLGLYLGVPAPSQAKEISAAESVYRVLLLDLIDVLQQQILLLQTELQARVETELNTVEITSLQKSVDDVIQYSITQPAAVQRIKNKQHREYFTRVFEIFPNEYDVKLRQLEVFAGEAYFDAFVETLPPDNKYWLYAAHEDLFYDIDSEPNTELIVHELAHIISYEEIIGVPRPAETSCSKYFKQYGCPAANSYLGQFVEMFWSGADLELASRRSDFEDAAAYYKTHKDEFVSEYAAQNPEEDFAESFLSFVVGGDEVGSTATKKINFFNQYQKLLSVRAEILQNK